MHFFLGLFLGFGEDVAETFGQGLDLGFELVVFVLVLVQHLFETQLLLVALLLVLVRLVGLG
jgi:hypothetical protein